MSFSFLWYLCLKEYLFILIQCFFISVMRWYNDNNFHLRIYCFQNNSIELIKENIFLIPNERNIGLAMCLIYRGIEVLCLVELWNSKYFLKKEKKNILLVSLFRRNKNTLTLAVLKNKGLKSDF